MYLLLGFLLAMVVMVALFWIENVFAKRRVASFAARHGLQPVRGGMEIDTPFTGTIAGHKVQIEYERRSLPRQGVAQRVVFLVHAPGSFVGQLRRYRGRFIERSQASVPGGMQRVTLPGGLSSHYELWAAGTDVPPPMLKKSGVEGLMQGFWPLESIQWLGGQVVVRVDGNLASGDRLERAWSLIEALLASEK